MSRRRLEEEVNNLWDEFCSREKIEKYSNSYQEFLINPDSFAHKSNKCIKQLDDEQRREIFAGIYEIAFDAYEEEYLAGDTKALMKCIDFCCTNKLVPPNWAAEAFHQGYTKISNCEEKSWDAVFGKPNKGKHKVKRSDEDKIKIYQYVREQINKGCLIDEELFSRAAKRFTGCSTEIKGIYYGLLHERLRREKSILEGFKIVRTALEPLGINPWQQKNSQKKVK